MRAVAPLLLEKGYVIKAFDLIDTDHSDAFNPFPYLKDDKDAMKLVNNLIKNTTPKNSTNNDPFWEKSEIALDTALILYLLHEAPPEEQNLEMVMYMIENGGAREDDDDFQSPWICSLRRWRRKSRIMWPCGNIRFSSRPPEKQPRVFY